MYSGHISLHKTSPEIKWLYDRRGCGEASEGGGEKNPEESRDLRVTLQSGARL